MYRNGGRWVCETRRERSYNRFMLIKKAPDIRSSEITPKSVYLGRREFIQALAAALVAAGLPVPDAVAQGGLAKLPNIRKSPLSTTETPSLYDHVTSYNNFYEFAPGAGDGRSPGGGPGEVSLDAPRPDGRGGHLRPRASFEGSGLVEPLVSARRE